MTALYRLQRDADLSHLNTFGVRARAPWLLHVNEPSLLAEALYTNSSSNLAAAIQCNHLGNIRYSGDHRSCNVRSR